MSRAHIAAASLAAVSLAAPAAAAHSRPAWQLRAEEATMTYALQVSLDQDVQPVARIYESRCRRPHGRYRLCRAVISWPGYSCQYTFAVTPRDWQLWGKPDPDCDF